LAPGCTPKTFDELKALLINAPVLADFDRTKEVTVQPDACQSGMGAMCLVDGKPVKYAPRALTATEQTFALCEKELLATVFAMELFHYYVYRRGVIVESDHRPLIAIVKKSLSSAPMRMRRMLLRFPRYNFQLVYRPKSELLLADTVSRAYPPSDATDDAEFTEELASLTDDEQTQQRRAVASLRTIDFIYSAADDDEEYYRNSFDTRLVRHADGS